MKLFDAEVQNMTELKELLATQSDLPSGYSVAVEALLFDSSSKWILMERGPGCGDEIGKLEGIGGRLNDEEEEFALALRREISEEVGTAANIDILRFFEVRRDTVLVPNSITSEVRHWIIISFICYLRSGELKVSEPTKNNGFIRLSLNEIEPGKLSSSAASAFESLRISWPEIKELLNRSHS